MTDRVLALDLATVTGWAVDRPSGGPVPACGIFRTPFAGGDDYGSGFAAFYDWLHDMTSLHQPTLLAFEAPLDSQNTHNRQATRVLIGMATLAETVAAARGITCFETHIQTVRKHFTGSGRSQKPDVMYRCRVLGWQVPNHDAADACAVWDYAHAVLRSRRRTAMARAAVS